VTISLKEAAAAIPGAVVVGDEDMEITGMEYHSRMITPSSLFVAIKGFQHDGNDWIDEAVNNGAVAVMTERRTVRSIPQIIVPDARAAMADLAAMLYSHPESILDIYGITGTNGKTTTCFLIKKMIEAAGKRAGLISSLVYDTGKDQIPAGRTTPESLDMYRLLNMMTRNKCSHAVVEISSHALILHRVKNLKVKVAVFTNITRDHLDFHTSMEDYLAAKALLLDMVDDPEKWAAINYDCEEFRPLFSRGRCRKMSYSVDDESADVHLAQVQLKPSGSHFELHAPGGMREIEYRLTGRYNLYNALAASAAALAGGLGLDAVAAGLANAEVVPGRLERIECTAPFSIFIDFAHTPDALRRTIETLRETSHGKILVLFGCGGDRDRGKRPLMGEAVTSLADYAVLTSDNPRSENPARIIDDVRPGLKGGAKVEIIEDRKEAVAHVLDQAHEGDVVLLAGKGAENYQEIKSVRHPYSDREEAAKQLDKRGYEVR
jgi:UDP-N-acetylmuramoyl-L-alanyl-D-glutamate--2,6-diaminopimelate ligase